MSESFAVKAGFQLETNVPETMRAVAQAFKDTNALIKEAQRSLRYFGAELQRLNRDAGGMGRLVKSVNTLSKARMNGGIIDDLQKMLDYSDLLTTAQDKAATAAERAASAWREAAQAAKSASGSAPTSGGPTTPTRPQHRRFLSLSHGEGMDAAFGLSMAGGAGLGLAERGFMAQAEVQQQIILARADTRVTAAEMGRLQAQISALQRTSPALQQVEAYKLFRENMGVFGDANEAIETLPGSVRLQQLYQLMSTARGGAGGDENLAATKAGDALQAFINPKTHQIDTQLFNQWIDFQTRSALAGGGIVDAKSWLAFARTARTGGIGLNMDALEYAQALLELSPGRTGTALQSAFQLFGASTQTLSNKNRAAWQAMGLVDRKGNLRNADAYQSEPARVSRRLVGLSCYAAKGMSSRAA